MENRAYDCNLSYDLLARVIKLLFVISENNTEKWWPIQYNLFLSVIKKTDQPSNYVINWSVEKINKTDNQGRLLLKL